MTVPKILHLTCPSGQVPTDLQPNIDELRRINPDWEIRVYSDADIHAFVNDQCDPDVRAAYTRLDSRYGAARADLFRYLILHHTGGAYLDMKSTCLVPLTSLAESSSGFVLAQWDNDPGEPHHLWGYEEAPVALQGGAFIQWFLLSSPQHPFLRATIDEVVARINAYSPFRDGVGKQAVLKTTGPIAFTEALLPILTLHPHRRWRKFTECGLVYSVFERLASSTRHRTVFGTHYTGLTRPLVRQPLGVAVAWQAAMVVRRMGQGLRAGLAFVTGRRSARQP